MAFALSVQKLKEAMGKPGCPVCRLSRQAAAHTVEMLLWENVTDIEVRKGILASYGFCPEHARLFVASELSNSGHTLGVNIIYEQLARRTADELQGLEREEKLAGGLRRFLQKLGGDVPTSGRPLAPKGVCPICQTVQQSAVNALITLFEELERATADIRDGYATSDGLCLAHLRLGLEQVAADYPTASEQVLEDAANRLQRQARLMQEYIRKNNWEYKDEKLTREENDAWRKTVAFFTGIPGNAFTHKKEEL